MAGVVSFVFTSLQQAKMFLCQSRLRKRPAKTGGERHIIDEIKPAEWSGFFNQASVRLDFINNSKRPEQTHGLELASDVVAPESR